MAKMEIHLPDDIAHYEGDLRYFFDSMVRKLHANRHKGFGDNCTVYEMADRARDELRELEEAIRDEGQFQAYMESVDVANFAFIAGLVLSRMTRTEFERMRARANPVGPSTTPNSDREQVAKFARSIGNGVLKDLSREENVKLFGAATKLDGEPSPYAAFEEPRSRMKIPGVNDDK